MVKVFGKTDTVFSTNGDAVLHPLKAKVHKEDNGAFYLDLETDLEFLDYLAEGNIVVAPTPQGDQAFRISNIQKTGTKVKTKALHVFYDSQNYLIADSYVVDMNCNSALAHLNSATEPVSAFSTTSDVGTVNSYRCIRKSLYQAQQTVLSRWGGHLVRNNFAIGISASIGVDNGVTVRYRKNLKEISCTEDWSKVVTKLLPTGKDGIMLNAINSGASIYVTSATQYAIPYTKTVSFSQSDIVEDDYRDEDGNVDASAYKQALVDDLGQQAQAYVDANCLPKVNYTLKANLEKITDIGDSIQVIDERLGINLLTNVIAYDYDCILGRYTEIQFGNFQQGLSGLVSSLNSQAEIIASEKAEEVAVVLGSELQEATDAIMGVLGNSYVIYDGDQILVVDSLPASSAHNVMRINAGGIGFSQGGINGTFNSAWTIDGTLNMQNINVINLVADLIKGGTLRLGATGNQSGILLLYDGANNLIGRMDKDGLRMFGQDGSYVLMNNSVGFAGYDRNDTKIYWASADEFHMKKSVVEEEITLCNKMRFIPIQILSGNTVVNDGIGLVSVGGGS